MKAKISHSYTELPLATQGKADKSLGGGQTSYPRVDTLAVDLLAKPPG